MILSIVMIACIALYVFGIPLGTVLVLWFNKKLLHPQKSGRSNVAQSRLQKRSMLFQSVFGSLYEPYERKYWWFESVIMIQKALLTGGLVMVAPGTSVQILIALIIALVFYTLLLKLQPYTGKDEDQLQTIATAATVATLLIGFALKATEGDGSDPERGTFDVAIMDGILMFLFAFAGVSGTWIMLKSVKSMQSLKKSALAKSKSGAKVAKQTKTVP